jgi:hypothetical protein
MEDPRRELKGCGWPDSEARWQTTGDRMSLAFGRQQPGQLIDANRLYRNSESARAGRISQLFTLHFERMAELHTEQVFFAQAASYRACPGGGLILTKACDILTRPTAS